MHMRGQAQMDTMQAANISTRSDRISPRLAQGGENARQLNPSALQGGHATISTLPPQANETARRTHHEYRIDPSIDQLSHAQRPD